MNMDTNDWFNYRLAKQYARLKNKEVSMDTDCRPLPRLEDAEERTNTLLEAHRKNMSIPAQIAEVRNDTMRMKATLQLVERRTFHLMRMVVCQVIIIGLLLVVHAFH